MSGPALAFHLNGKPVVTATVPTRRLSDLLREDLGQTGTKVGCDAGDCGACTVLLDGAAVCACMVPAGQVSGRHVETVEGLANGNGAGDDAELSGLQASFLRHDAAQCGICTPGMLMAAAALLRSKPKPTAEEVEQALAGVLCRCTGYRKIIDAVCDAWRGPENTNGQPGDGPVGGPTSGPVSGTAIGARLQRVDGVPKVDGSSRFGADSRSGDTLVVLPVRSPHHSADFDFGDLEAWKDATDGVAAIFTAADIPGRNCFGVIPPFADQPALAVGRARFRGEAVALVAVEAECVHAIDLAGFPVVWRENQALLGVAAAKADGAPLVHEARAGNFLTEGLVRQGDIDAAFADAAFTVSGRVQTGFIEHAYIEPEAGDAWMDGDVLVIRACTQAPVMDRDDTAAILGLAQDKVRIIPAATGGGFGSKLDVSLQPLLGLVTLRTGRPSRMVYTRSDSMASTTKRHPASIEARFAADAEGRVIAMDFAGDFDTGAYASWGPTVANRVPVHATGPYRTGAMRAVGRAIHTNGPPSGAFRGFGVPQAAIAQETLYDKLADAAGLDRLAFRIRNAYVDGDRTATGQVLHGVGIRDCLEALEGHWQRARAEARAFNADKKRGIDKKRGVGVASCWYGCGNTSLPNPSTIRVGIKADGTLVLHQGATDIGQGANTVISQICADALGLPVAAFTLVGGDTHLTPDAGKTSASRQTYVTGKAAELAGKALRAAILRHANVDGEAVLSLEGGTLNVNGEGTRSIDLKSLAPDAGGFVFVAEETYDPPTAPLDENGQGKPYAVYGYGAQMVELEVDVPLGTVRLIRIVAAHDVGRAINPMLAEGQIEGGIAQGIGLAMMEEFEPGRTENLHDYLIPTIGDVPPVESILIEKPDPEGPYGAKGLGEHVLIPTAPAILNAIRDATGAEVTRLPALPHRVRAAIEAARALADAGALDPKSQTQEAQP